MSHSSKGFFHFYLIFTKPRTDRVSGPGRLIADLEATLLDHPVAKSIFFTRLNNLDLNNLFPCDPALGEIPGKSLLYVVPLNP